MTAPAPHPHAARNGARLTRLTTRLTTGLTAGLTPIRHPPRAAARLLATALLPAALLAGAPVQAQPLPGWPQRLQADLAALRNSGQRADIGVYVRELDSGAEAAFQADQVWYLASTVKLPVALTVLDQVQRGLFTLDTQVTLRASDYVDGAGPTNGLRVGTRRPVRWLLEQMITLSDNTASDMLIDLVGLRNVNALVQQQLQPQPQTQLQTQLQTQPKTPGTGNKPVFQPITTLADVRRHIYGQLTPSAVQLSGHDFLLLKQQPGDLARRQLLAQLLHVPLADFKLRSVADAYDAYYASGLNSARLDAYGELLARVTQGLVLDPPRTAYLLALMERTRTGPERIKAGLPRGVRWAHKTGTQSARTCDSGVITVPRPAAGGVQRVVVAACTRGDTSAVGADRALQQVGAAICRSGLFGALDPVREPSERLSERLSRRLAHPFRRDPLACPAALPPLPPLAGPAAHAGTGAAGADLHTAREP